MSAKTASKARPATGGERRQLLQDTDRETPGYVILYEQDTRVTLSRVGGSSRGMGYDGVDLSGSAKSSAFSSIASPMTRQRD